MQEPHFLYRIDAMRAAAKMARSADPQAYAKKHKLEPNSLAVAYAEALRKHMQTECMAKAEDLADEEVSARLGWQTLRQIRVQVYADARRTFGI